MREQIVSLLLEHGGLDMGGPVEDEEKERDDAVVLNLTRIPFVSFQRRRLWSMASSARIGVSQHIRASLHNALNKTPNA
jgi:hypothetical protein